MHGKQRLIDAGKYALLAAAMPNEAAAVNNAHVGAYRTKTTTAGDYLYIAAYPLLDAKGATALKWRYDGLMKDPVKRAALLNKYAKANNKRRRLEFEMLVHANFFPGDFHVCCTYAPEDYGRPDTFEYRTREEAKREIWNYLRRIKNLLQRYGVNLAEFRWTCTTVTKEAQHEAVKPRPDRHHHHLLLHGVPLELRNDIEKLWTFGYCDTDVLQNYSDKGLSDMAQYIARQEGSANGERRGERSYTTSRNIIRPQTVVNDRKISRRRASRIADDVRSDGIEIFETLYPGYRCVEPPTVYISDFTAGAYIYAKMRRKPPADQFRQANVQHQRVKMNQARLRS